MPRREAQDRELRDKRDRDDIKVLTYLLKEKTLKRRATGRLESSQKLAIFYAGYIAIRRLWERKIRDGKVKTGNEELDAREGDPKSLVYRIDREVAHAIGCPTRTLFRVATFKYWGRTILKQCGQ